MFVTGKPQNAQQRWECVAYVVWLQWLPNLTDLLGSYSMVPCDEIGVSEWFLGSGDFAIVHASRDTYDGTSGPTFAALLELVSYAPSPLLHLPMMVLTNRHLLVHQIMQLESRKRCRLCQLPRLPLRIRNDWCEVLAIW
ncbi:uncharacterized protein CIMG_10840 [Coccidioides immitis RS]|uniref:Uncharacterized protein n=1 Tax=Coccidioides immitis (strain RS) TaxID=246410 RepID=A0A0D8JV05_COCIM|nr:uncharacterized protein CIMG_10840 [Coccidioides immitis RS]KJF60098.1 hypothetical protein CIMG_10840 [Coccidioides immitis RS]